MSRVNIKIEDSHRNDLVKAEGEVAVGEQHARLSGDADGRGCGHQAALALARIAAAVASSSSVATPASASGRQYGPGMLSRCLHDRIVWMDWVVTTSTIRASPAVLMISA